MRSALALLCCSVSTVAAIESNPVQKVLELLDSLSTKVVSEGESEQKQYEEFADWCEDSAKEKQYEIRTGESKAEDLSASIEKAAADISTFESRIGELAAAVSTHDADLASATKIRDNEAGNFATEHAELSNTIDMLGRAVSILKREMGQHSFVQMSKMNGLMQAMNAILAATVVNSEDKTKLTALMQQSSQDDDDSFLEGPAGSPSAKVYEGHSGAIIDTLEDMLDKAEQMKSDSEKAEQNAVHNYSMLAQSLTDEAKFESERLTQTKHSKAATEEAKAQAEGELSGTNKDLSEDKDYLEEVHRDCMEKATNWEVSQKSRAQEIDALTKAKAVISKMSGGASGRSYALLFQTESQENGANLALLSRVVSSVSALAEKVDDSVLAQLGFRLRVASSSSEDPFTKVKGLIQEMIERLIADQQREADHKAYCDKEMSESEAKIDEKSSIIDRLTSKLDKAHALIAQLTSEVAALREELAHLAKSQQQMNEMRHNEHTEYEVSRKEFQDGVEGINMALRILHDYYASAALVQQPSTSVHSKAAGEATGIIAMLEVIESDFSRNLADCEATEKSAEEEYERLTQENEVAVAQKNQDVKYKSHEKTKTEVLTQDLSADRTGEQSELDAVNEYYQRLSAQCIAKPESYSERKKRREAEIAGLKNALQILEGEALAFLQKRQ